MAMEDVMRITLYYQLKISKSYYTDLEPTTKKYMEISIEKTEISVGSKKLMRWKLEMYWVLTAWRMEISRDRNLLKESQAQVFKALNVLGCLIWRNHYTNKALVPMLPKLKTQNRKWRQGVLHDQRNKEVCKKRLQNTRCHQVVQRTKERLE